MSGMTGASMLRTRRKDVNVKPNRKWVLVTHTLTTKLQLNLQKNYKHKTIVQVDQPICARGAMCACELQLLFFFGSINLHYSDTQIKLS